MSAAGGALISDRERQFEMLNRVQDNYVYFINNINRLFISGGAGTGKTFIALKLLRKFEKNGNVLYLCYGKRLKHFIKDQFPNSNVELISLENDILPKSRKYDFIVVDEAQDLDFEQARSILNLLRDSSSHLYVFYDQSQNVFNKEFKNGFDIELPPFLLRENLRNTSSIYKFAVERTELGKDVIANPIVGPDPETILLKKQNYKEKLEDLINYLVFDEFVFHKDICIIAESTVYSELLSNTFFKWNLKSTINPNDNEIKLFTISDYKGLESNVIIYIRSSSLSKIGDYIAYTRARYYLYEILID
jgi:DNA helicase IV